MGYVNVGAFVNGHRPKSKKALREALAADPASVRFDATSVFDEGEEFRGDAIPEGLVLSVCGPNPYTARRWYGQVEATADGPAMK